jgi:CBS domain-containing protein
VYAESNDSVASVMKKLKDNNISSVPVKDTGTSQFVGCIDILDIVTFVYTKFAKVSLLAQESYQQMEDFANQKVGDILNISGRNHFHSIPYNLPLSDLLSKLTNPNIHRIAVTNESLDIVGFITQSKILEFFYQNRKNLEPSLKKLLQENVDSWIMAQGPVQTISMKEFMIEACRKIWESQVTGIAVVDDDGKLVANVSASDLKKVHVLPIGELIKDLYQPIKQFLHIRADIRDKVMMAKLPRADPIFVSKDDTMEKVLESVYEKRIHRVFLVDDQKKPTSVISLGDLIARLLERSTQ